MKVRVYYDLVPDQLYTFTYFKYLKPIFPEMCDFIFVGYL